MDSRFTTPGERRVATRIVNAAIAAGYHLHVWDGEEWTIQACRNAKPVLDALATTGSDVLRLRNGSERFGDIVFVWGNAADGSELVADMTAPDHDKLAALESFVARA